MHVPTGNASRIGFTLLEALVVLAIVGVIFGISFPFFVTPSARAFGNDANALVQRSRFEAVKRDLPVAVVFDEGTNVIRMAVTTDSTAIGACASAATVIDTLDAAEYRQTMFSSTVSTDALVWLPTGRPVTCNGSPNVVGELTVTDSSSTRTYLVDIGGRLTLQ